MLCHVVVLRQIIRDAASLASHADEFRHRPLFPLLGALVKPRLHPQRCAFPAKGLLELLANIRIFFVIGDRVSTVANVYGAEILFHFTGTARAAAACIVWPKPRRHPQRVLADAEMLVEPVAAHRGRTDHTDGLIINAKYLIGLSARKWVCPDLGRPGVGISLAGETN